MIAQVNRKFQKLKMAKCSSYKKCYVCEIGYSSIEQHMSQFISSTKESSVYYNLKD